MHPRNAHVLYKFLKTFVSAALPCDLTHCGAATLEGVMSDLDDGDFLDKEAEEDSDEQSGIGSDDSSEEEEEEEGETVLDNR